MTATLPVGASEAVEVRDAATVLLLRDGDDGLEVAMLRRRLDSGFVPGAYVFPGGALDEGDRSPGWAARSAGLDDASASARLALPAGGLAYWLIAGRGAGIVYEPPKPPAGLPPAPQPTVNRASAPPEA